MPQLSELARDVRAARISKAQVGKANWFSAAAHAQRKTDRAARRAARMGRRLHDWTDPTLNNASARARDAGAGLLDDAETRARAMGGDARRSGYRLIAAGGGALAAGGSVPVGLHHVLRSREERKQRR